MILMNYDLTVIERSGYTLLDMLADVGGLQGMLVSTISIFLNIWNFNFFDNYLVSKLFRASSGDTKKKPLNLSSN